MELEEAVVAQLMADVSVTGLIAKRLYPQVIPEDAPLPALAYQRVTGEEPQTHDMGPDWGMGRIQFTAQATSYNAAKSVVRKVIKNLNGYVGRMGGVAGVLVHGVFFENVIDGFNDETDRQTVRVDADFLHLVEV